MACLPSRQHQIDELHPRDALKIGASQFQWRKAGAQSTFQEAPAVAGDGPSVHRGQATVVSAHGLHIVLLAVKELHALIKGRGHKGRLTIGNPGLKEGLLGHQGLFATGEWVAVKGLRQFIQGLLVFLRCCGLQDTPEGITDQGFFGFGNRLFGFLALALVGRQVVGELDHRVQVTFGQRQAR